MAYPVQQEFEVFLAESIGLQLANLRHHLALCSANCGRDQRPLTKEQFAQIDELIETMSQKAHRLHERLRQEAAPSGVNQTGRDATPYHRPTSTRSRCGPGLSSVLEHFASS